MNIDQALRRTSNIAHHTSKKAHSEVSNKTCEKAIVPVNNQGKDRAYDDKPKLPIHKNCFIL